MSFRLSRLVVPIIGAVTPVQLKFNACLSHTQLGLIYAPSFEIHHATATCAMLISLFFEISSTLDAIYHLVHVIEAGSLHTC